MCGFKDPCNSEFTSLWTLVTSSIVYFSRLLGVVTVVWCCLPPPWRPVLLIPIVVLIRLTKRLILRVGCVKNHAAGTAHGQTCPMHARNRQRVQDYVDASPITDVDLPLCGRCLRTVKNEVHVPSCSRSSVWWDGRRVYFASQRQVTLRAQVAADSSVVCSAAG